MRLLESGVLGIVHLPDHTLGRGVAVTANGATTGHGTSGNDGQFKVGLAPGRYRVSFREESTGRAASTSDVVVEKGKLTNLGDVVLGGAGTITGVVKLAGNPYAAVDVELTHDSLGVFAATVDTGGTFTAEKVPEGTLVVRATSHVTGFSAVKTVDAAGDPFNVNADIDLPVPFIDATPPLVATTAAPFTVAVRGGNFHSAATVKLVQENIPGDVKYAEKRLDVTFYDPHPEPTGIIEVRNPDGAFARANVTFEDIAVQFPLVLCIERKDTTVETDDLWDYFSKPHLFPWTNSGFYYHDYRNQYLFPSSTLQELRDAGVMTIESIHSRAVSFTGTSVNNYAAASRVRVTETQRSTLVRTFSANQLPAEAPVYLDRIGEMTIKTATADIFGTSNPNPALLSDCTSCGSDPMTRNDLAVPITLPKLVPPTMNILVDTLLRNGGGNSGTTAWDLTSGPNGCDGPQRAYGMSQSRNPNFLTTAYGVDEHAFVWVFRGRVLLGSAKFSDKTGDLIRMLLTPKGKRAAGLDGASGER